MSLKLENETYTIQVRNKLLNGGIKLWLHPYYNEESGPCIKDLKELAENFSKSLNIPSEECQRVLQELQQAAIDKLQQRKQFENSGIATLKVKVLNFRTSPSLINVQITLTSLGSDLKSQICNTMTLSAEKIKLISNGKVLCDTTSLLTQGVKNGNQILALTLSESAMDVREAESQVKEVETVKADTRMLASDNEMYMELEDQQGNPIRIPKKERKALMVAMALHEKGRSALKKEEYGKALVFLLDADHEFSTCNSKLLQTVDNYALLDLDIVWSYLCLQSVNHLPEAYQRLKRCEQMFAKSYGTNLERVIAVKGTPGNEAALLLRLHLLQGIVLFHQSKNAEALQMLKKVEGEMKILKVDEASLLTLVELGYTSAEARIGLRMTNGDVNRAANVINENREKRDEARKNALKEKILQREQQKLGKCSDGKQFVNPTFVKMLVNMGYNKEVARSALQSCNNNISESVQYIQEHPGPSNTRSQEILSLINDLIPELEAAGFDTQMAHRALVKHNGDIMKAAEELLANNGIIEGEIAEVFNIQEKNKAKRQEAYLRLAEDISSVDDDHLDLTLEQEETFLMQYLSLLGNGK